jgi:plastocyanin
MKFEYYIIGGMLFLVLGVLALVAASPLDIPLPKHAGMISLDKTPQPAEESEPVMETETIEIEEKVSVTVTPAEETSAVVEESTEESAIEVMPPVVMIAKGSGVPGCEATNECFIPYELKISVSTEVTWNNQDVVAHTVTSGTTSVGPDGVFDSSLFLSAATFSHKFDAAGEYNYFCMVHPWMQGKIIVE